MPLERGVLLADDSLTGAAWCRAHSDLVDTWLAGLMGRSGAGGDRGAALLAVGGYGRAELCPNSDIDVMLLHDRRADIAKVADRLWYPIWDAGLHLGHSVCTVRQALGLADETLDTATALLSARHVAGDETLTSKLVTAARAAWEKRASRWLTEMAGSVEARHHTAGEVAFQLEPDLKEGRGGLRDVHALHWAEAARSILLEYDTVALAEAYAVLLDARVELHRRTGRAANTLVAQEQEGVGRALGLGGADGLMAAVAGAGRTIAWTSDDTWRRIRSMLRGPFGRAAHNARPLAPGVMLNDGEVELEPSARPAEDPALVLRVAAMAAGHDTVIARHSLERLVAETAPMPDPWPDEARSRLADLLLAGRAAIGVVEALDQRGVWTRVLPEWEPTRSRPQHNPYHRFTIDRHLLEAAANAAELRDRVDRPDLLVVGALLHDIGKGRPGDHTEVGVGLTEQIATRMGFAADDVSTLAAMVQHHLLLPDVASRRDLDDPAAIAPVAEAIGSLERLQLLAALTEADSLATGPTAWGPWKADLMGQLVERVTQVLSGGELAGVVEESFPTGAQLARLAEAGRHIDVSGDRLTVMTGDRPGIFSRIAGVLALHGLNVLTGVAYCSEDGRALAEFRVLDPIRDRPPWPRVVADLERVLDGRLALNARLAKRSRTYDRPHAAAAQAEPVSVGFDNRASSDATVIDVYAPDHPGVLYRITRALAELDLDIRSARVQTLGAHVVDSFYIRDSRGRKVTDDDTLLELEQAVVHSVAE